MKNLNVMIKPASSLCNMRCKYCFYADVAAMRTVPSFGVMTEGTADAILARLGQELTAGDTLAVTFQGGEPTLAGLLFFQSFTKKASALSGVRITYALQTNGTMLDEEWCAFLKEHGFLVGLSLDLLPKAHDATRTDAAGKGTYRRVCDSMRLLKKHGVDFNVLCTLTGEVARHPGQVWRSLVELDVTYVQFTPCLGELEGSPSPYALTPERFASFYKQLFALWYADFKAGRKRSVKLFDDVVNQLILGIPTGCGMDGRCRPQLVVEADGTAYPCDFYCLDEYRLGNAADTPVSELLSSPGAEAFLSRPRTRPAACANCPYTRFCGGNCPRMEREITVPSHSTYCGYRDFLDTCGTALASLAEEIKRVKR